MAAKKKAEKTENKSAFVRSLPASLSAKEVVAEGKKNGMKLTEAYVYKVRSGAKKAAGGKAAPKAPAAKGAPAAKAAAGGKTTATAFVKALPAGTSAKEAVAKAKAAGIPLTEGYFYTLRSSLGIAGGKGGKAGPAAKAPAGPKGKAGKAPAGKGAASPGLRITSNNAREQSIIDAVFALGADRARKVLEAAARFA